LCPWGGIKGGGVDFEGVERHPPVSQPNQPPEALSMALSLSGAY